MVNDKRYGIEQLKNVPNNKVFIVYSESAYKFLDSTFYKIRKVDYCNEYVVRDIKNHKCITMSGEQFIKIL